MKFNIFCFLEQASAHCLNECLICDKNMVILTAAAEQDIINKDLYCVNYNRLLSIQTELRNLHLDKQNGGG